jgi:class 3 adenylate cyclase
VKAANWLSHLEFDWQSPIWRHWVEGLARNHLLVRYDERGCGLSEWDVEDFSFEAWVRDLEAVVDAAGLERFPLLGISQGGPVAIAYTVRHPERVSHLILYGTFALGAMKWLSDEAREDRQIQIRLVELGWGRDNPAFRQVFTTQFMPEATAEEMRWFDELQRASTSAENAVRVLRVSGDIDVVNEARQVRVPTLVLHARGDARVPFDQGRRVASLIPGARFVPLESKNHILLRHEPAWDRFLHEVHSFLGVPGESAAPPPDADRFLATVLFTDIVGSTNLATELGDHEWRRILDSHDEFARRQVARHRGTLVKTTGDGILATFDGPVRAVRCALALSGGLQEIGVEIRAGIHTGELERRGEDVGGIGVHIAARIQALAESGEILVSRTVRDLMTGSGFAFSDRGLRTLKGVLEPWQVFALDH